MKLKANMTTENLGALKKEFAAKLGGTPAVKWAELFAGHAEGLIDANPAVLNTPEGRNTTFGVAQEVADTKKPIAAISFPLANQFLVAAWAYGPAYAAWLAERTTAVDAEFAELMDDRRVA